MSIEFLGNKAQLGDFISSNILRYTKDCDTCFDLFSGSGSVSALFKEMGFRVYANDFLYFTAMITKAILLNNTAPSFEGLDIDFGSENNESRYKTVLNYLNNLCGEKGFIYTHYSPASINCDGVERMYFTVENAKKIDAIRGQIEKWDSFLKENEKALLISDLLSAVSSVSNNAGTYGCYMKHWKKKAIQPLVLVPTRFVQGKNSDEKDITCSNAEEIIDNIRVDIIYADPPYTKRQYSAYYHILETIACYDSPSISGSTGLRNWKEKSSDFCYKRKAIKALEGIVQRAKCKYFVLSYNNEGQMTNDEILNCLKQKGDVVVREQKYKKYKSNSAVKNKNVIERLYIVRMKDNNGSK